MAAGRITGLPELSKNLQELAKMIDGDAVESGLLKIGGELRRVVRARAPRGKTGNLIRSQVSKKFRNKIKGAPATFVAVNYGLGPHAHLVEFGHGGPAPAPPHPFFRPAVDSFKTGYEGKVATMLKKKFDDWALPGNQTINQYEPTFQQVAESM